MNLPANYYSKVDKKLSSVSGQLTKKSIKYLEKLQKQQLKIQASIKKLNPESVRLFAGTKEKYTSFLEGFKSKTSKVSKLMGGEYNSYLDTLGTSLSFLKQFKELCDKVKGPLTDLDQLQCKLTVLFHKLLKENSQLAICLKELMLASQSWLDLLAISLYKFKRANGAAGKGKAWHHIVEQNPNNIKKFGAEAIHTERNLVKVNAGKGSLHSRVTGYYNSKIPGTNMRVRDFVNKMGYEEQFKHGMEILKKFGL